MADPFLGEVRIFPYNFAPNGWAPCNGQMVQVRMNTALFSILGTTYGGDGKTTFALPNLQDSVPVGMGQGPGLTPRQLGETGGEANVTLLSTEIPSHTHTLSVAFTDGELSDPSNNYLSAETKTFPYTPAGNSVVMSPMAIGPAGSGLPHENRQPYLAFWFCIAVQGIFPTRS
ncbi:MAG: phage tail protein [Candidatus Wallbacteria bacterium]|nr:phage tail protein [Candidatus Wallbacteria bacterium]MBI4867373.1 phage tail protein [Candidatus Wallbacteria bacterium]